MAQKSIKDFLKPMTNKARSVADFASNCSPNKKFKGSTHEIKENLEVKTDHEELTENDKARIEKNKLKAQIRAFSKKCPALHDSIGEGWFKSLKSEFSKEYFQSLSSFVFSERSRYTVYPPPNQVYSWSNYCDIKDIRVVILGQDPYHGIGQAHGLCFSVQKGIPPPPSLINIYKELENDVPGFKHPGHGCLVGWAKQGVLLLNACLTVRANNANSHKDRGWEQFTDAVIKAVSDENDGVVFLLWGSYAQKKAAVVDKKRHHRLNAPHPSPLSAHRGFFGCKHFSKCNELLSSKGKKPIDWKFLPVDS